MADTELIANIELVAGSTSGLRRLRLLVAVKELVDETGVVEPWREKILERAGESGLDYHAFAEDAETMKADGWVSFEESLTGVDSLRLTQYGRDLAEEFVRLRQDAPRRFRRITDDVLKWLYDYYHRDVSPNGLGEYLDGPRACYLGVRYTNSELIRAWKRLKEQEYAKSVKDLWGEEVFRPFITKRGYELVESRRSVFDPALAGNGNQTSYHSNVNISHAHGVNVAMHSSNVNQSNTLTADQLQSVKDKAEALKAILNGDMFGASDDLKTQAADVLAEIGQEAASSEPKSGKMKELFGKLEGLIVNLGSQLLITTTNGMIDQVMASLN